MRCSRTIKLGILVAVTAFVGSFMSSSVLAQQQESLKELLQQARQIQIEPQPFKIELKIEGEKSSVQEGDSVRFVFRSPRKCYLTLLALNKDDNVVQLFPNEWHASNLVEADQDYKVPPEQSKFNIMIVPPTGKMEFVTAIASLEPIKTTQSAPATTKGKFKQFDKPRLFLKDLIGELRGKTEWSAAELSFWSDSPSPGPGSGQTE